MPSERVRRQVDRLLDQVEEAVNHDAWDEVTEKAGRVLGVDPDIADALAFIAMAGGDVAGEISDRGDGSSPPNAESDTPSSFANGGYEVTGLLGDNLNIEPTFGSGEEDGRPYMVTQLTVCGDVEGLLEVAGDPRPSGRHPRSDPTVLCIWGRNKPSPGPM